MISLQEKRGIRRQSYQGEMSRSQSLTATHPLEVAGSSSHAVCCLLLRDKLLSDFPSITFSLSFFLSVAPVPLAEFSLSPPFPQANYNFSSFPSDSQKGRKEEEKFKVILRWRRKCSLGCVWSRLKNRKKNERPGAAEGQTGPWVVLWLSSSLSVLVEKAGSGSLRVSPFPLSPCLDKKGSLVLFSQRILGSLII